LHFFWTVLFAGVALYWAVQGARSAIGMARLPWLRDANIVIRDKSPLLSIIFAARDEQAKMPDALRTLLAQDYPNYEIVAVNDRSADRTLEILRELAETEPRLRVIDVEKLPPGWLGKPHGLAAGFAASRGEWLIFTDADVHFATDVLTRALSLAEAHNWDHLTLLANVEMRGFWERTAVTYFGLVFVLNTEPWQTANPRSKRFTGIGAFQLVRRAAYEAAGGHERLRLEVVDDMKLGKLIKLAGFRSGVAVAQDSVSVRWHEGLRAIVKGVTKNMFAAFNFNLALSAVMLFGVLLVSVAPFFGVFLASGWARIFAGAAVAMALLIHAATIVPTDVPVWIALTHPLGAMITCWMIIRSATVTLARGGVVWRDTFYPIEELRKGIV